jgi:hypothetical protein
MSAADHDEDLLEAVACIRHEQRTRTRDTSLARVARYWPIGSAELRKEAQ